MKKGLLAMLVALACATTCAFALPACDNDEPGDNGGAQTVAIESVTLDKKKRTDAECRRRRDAHRDGVTRRRDG